MSSVHRVVHVAKMTGVSGMERHLLTLLPGLNGCGLEASLIVLVEPDKPLDHYIEEAHSLGIQAEQMVINRHLDLELINQLAHKFRESGCDAVHTHLIHADLHGIRAAKQAGIARVFFTAHNDDGFRHRLPIRLLQGWLWRQVEAGITISEALRQFVIKVEFAPPTRVHTIHYGLDPATIAFDPNAREALCAELGINRHAPIAGSVCRLTGQKGITYAIAAFQEIVQRFPNTHYVIVGDGPLREHLQTQVVQSSLQQHVHFLGWRESARAMLPAFDVLLMPSLWEGFGLVLLEAMAARLPVIASKVSAMPEIVVDGQTGYLVPPADSAALAERLTELFSNREFGQALGAAGRQRLERDFSVPRMVEGTLKVYA
ncbi:MAG: glycosyltransferase family 4 protein [Chloroflexota bacterium]